MAGLISSDRASLQFGTAVRSGSAALQQTLLCARHTPRRCLWLAVTWSEVLRGNEGFLLNRVWQTLVRESCGRDQKSTMPSKQLGIGGFEMSSVTWGSFGDGSGGCAPGEECFSSCRVWMSMLVLLCARMVLGKADIGCHQVLAVSVACQVDTSCISSQFSGCRTLTH